MKIEPPPNEKSAELLRVAIITPEELARTHGVGAQLLQIYSGHKNYWHFYWHSFHGTESESKRSTKLPIWPLKQRGFGKISKHALQLAGLAWWYGDRINALRFRSLLDKLGGFDVVHLVVSDESQAKQAASMIRNARLPFVLTFYDLMHDDGLSREETPTLIKLIENASSVLVLTPPMAREISRFTKSVTRIGVGLESSADICQNEQSERVTKIVITGRPYRRGLDVLKEAWPQIKTAFPAAELHYIGSHFSSFPPLLRESVHNHGFVSSDSDYANLISGMTMGLLTGPDENDCFGKYSFPSRAANLCMAGLPLIACVQKNSATVEVFSELKQLQFHVVNKAVDFVPAMSTTLADYWEKRRLSQRFAEQYFDIDQVRSAVSSALLQSL